MVKKRLLPIQKQTFTYFRSIRTISFHVIVLNVSSSLSAVINLPEKDLPHLAFLDTSPSYRPCHGTSIMLWELDLSYCGLCARRCLCFTGSSPALDTSHGKCVSPIVPCSQMLHSLRLLLSVKSDVQVDAPNPSLASTTPMIYPLLLSTSPLSICDVESVSLCSLIIDEAIKGIILHPPKVLDLDLLGGADKRVSRDYMSRLRRKISLNLLQVPPW
jgi:hypothetical protein